MFDRSEVLIFLNYAQNPLFDKNIIAKKAEDLLAEYKTATAIVEHFQLRRGV